MLDLLKSGGFPAAAGKFCANDAWKVQLDAQAALKVQTLPIPGMNGTTVTVFCADSRILQVAGLLSAATLAVSSQLI